MKRLSAPAPVEWAPGWVVSPIKNWLQRTDGFEVGVDCVMDDPDARPCLRVSLFDEPALSRHQDDPAFQNIRGALLEAMTPREAVAEVDRRWPRSGDPEAS